MLFQTMMHISCPAEMMRRPSPSGVHFALYTGLAAHPHSQRARINSTSIRCRHSQEPRLVMRWLTRHAHETQNVKQKQRAHAGTPTEALHDQSVRASPHMSAPARAHPVCPTYAFIGAPVAHPHSRTAQSAELERSRVPLGLRSSESTASAGSRHVRINKFNICVVMGRWRARARNLYAPRARALASHLSRPTHGRSDLAPRLRAACCRRTTTARAPPRCALRSHVANRAEQAASIPAIGTFPVRGAAEYPHERLRHGALPSRGKVPDA